MLNYWYKAVDAKCRNLERREIAADLMDWNEEWPKRMGKMLTRGEEEEVEEGIPEGREENGKGAK